MTELSERSEWNVTVPHHPQGARLARHRLAASLTDLLPATVLADVVAVAGELIGNAVRHAAPLPGGVVRVAWRLLRGDATGAGAVEIRVIDGGAARPPVERRAAADEPDGRGLTIVRALSDRWGVDRDGPGQCVWARLVVPALRPSAPAFADARV